MHLIPARHVPRQTRLETVKSDRVVLALRHFPFRSGKSQFKFFRRLGFAPLLNLSHSTVFSRRGVKRKSEELNIRQALIGRSQASYFILRRAAARVAFKVCGVMTTAFR